MLPLSLLKTAINHPMLVELKNGETYNGHLASCDAWMNVYLTQVICTSRDGDRFWKMSECYIRGSTIKYMRIPDEVIENYKEESQTRGGGGGGRRDNYQGNRSGGRGGGGGGGGGGRSGGGQGGGQNRGNFNNNQNRGGFNNNNNQNRRPNQNSGGSNQNMSGGGRPAKQPRK